MSAPNHHSLRVVVQHVYVGQRSSYRLIAPGDGQTHRLSEFDSEFDSLHQLLRALHSVVPYFDESTLSIREGAHETYIALSGEIELDDSGLSILGLKDGTKS